MILLIKYALKNWALSFENIKKLEAQLLLQAEKHIGLICFLFLCEILAKQNLIHHHPLIDYN